MRWIRYIFFGFALILASCSGEPPLEKAILGTWVQETPTSMTTRGIQTTTTDTVLKLQKNGKTHLTRNLVVKGQKLPANGMPLRVELQGHWEIINGQLTQTQSSALILPQIPDEISRAWADKLQKQADSSSTSVKNIVLANKTQLILQDTTTGTTDSYRRK